MALNGTLNGSQHIRRELNQHGVETSAKDIQNILARQGFDVTLPLIYNIKSTVRAERAAEAAKVKDLQKPVDVKNPAVRAALTRAANEKPVGDFIREVMAHGRPMTGKEILQSVIKKGYKNTNQQQGVSKKLRLMLADKSVTQVNGKYVMPNVVQPTAVASIPAAPVLAPPVIQAMPPEKPPVMQVTHGATSVEFSNLKDVASLCRKVGGIENVQNCLDILKEVDKLILT